jgi:uncharacterized protein (TIRG00374 family)
MTKNIKKAAKNSTEIFKKIAKILFVIAILVLTIYQLLKDLDFELFAEIFKQINWIYCLISIPVIALSHWVRAIRWKVFLAPIHNAKSNLNLFSSVMVGYFVNSVTPRGGELVRPFVYARRENISKSSVFATIIVERFIDVVFLLMMLGIVFFVNKNLISQAFPQLSNERLMIFVGLVFLAVILLFLIITTNLFDIILEKVAKSISPKHYNRINEIWNSFKKGFSTLKNPKNYFKIFVYSTLIWALYALPLYLLFYAFGFQNTLNLGVFDAGLLIIVSGVGTSIAPTPSGIGVYHWLIVTAMLQLYANITHEAALAYATLSHGLTLLVQVLLGGFFLIRENLHKLHTKKEFE